MPKLTKPVVASLQPKEKEYIVWDADVKGLGVRVTPAGAKSYIVKGRIGRGRAAPVRKPTLGKCATLTLDEARDKARTWLSAARNGEDPDAERRKEAEAPTVARLARDYLERHAARKRTADQDRRKLERNILPRLGKKKKVADVTHRDIEDIHRALKATPYEANRNAALLSRMFELAVRWQWRPDNPVKGLERYHEEKRERFLSSDEIARLSEALRQYEAEATREGEAAGNANAIRLLMLTGARRGEVLSARWDQFDLKGGAWTKPSSHTKQKKEHRVPLSPPALQLLQEMSAKGRDASGYLFPGRTGGKTGHLTEIKKPWDRVRKLAGIEDVRLHDLRHTFASILVSGGASLPLIGALLGHTQPGTTARYAHLFDDPLREATAKVGAVYERAGNGGKGGSVVPLRKA